MTTEAMSETLTYDVYINEPPPQEGVLPPTAALATLVFRGACWDGLDRDKAELVAFVRPRELP